MQYKTAIFHAICLTIEKLASNYYNELCMYNTANEFVYVCSCASVAQFISNNIAQTQTKESICFYLICSGVIPYRTRFALILFSIFHQKRNRFVDVGRAHKLLHLCTHVNLSFGNWNQFTLLMRFFVPLHCRHFWFFVCVFKATISFLLKSNFSFFSFICTFTRITSHFSCQLYQTFIHFSLRFCSFF